MSCSNEEKKVFGAVASLSFMVGLISSVCNQINNPSVDPGVSVGIFFGAASAVWVLAGVIWCIPKECCSQRRRAGHFRSRSPFDRAENTDQKVREDCQQLL